MTRVSENSQSAALQLAINRAKRRMEDLQLRGSTLRNITRPSDNPVSTTEVLQLKSLSSDNNQYQKNIQHALLNLNTTEQAIEQLTEIMSKAKEIAIAQSSDFYDSEIRKSVAQEVKQLKNQALSIANKRIGQRFIFGGHKTLDRPFNNDGSYNGDKGHTTVEVAKDFFVPINLHGKEVFYSSDESFNEQPHPLRQFPELAVSPNHGKEASELEFDEVDRPRPMDEARAPAGVDQSHMFQRRQNIFSILDGLSAGLENNSSATIQELLPMIEDAMNRLVSQRTKVGSIVNSIYHSQNIIEQENLNFATRKSHLADADIAELFSDITKQQGVLKTTYQSGQASLNQTLLDFLR